MQPSPIQTIVMRRVRTMHAIKPLLSTMAISLAVFFVALWAIGREVWVAHVLKNMPSPIDVAAFVHFYMAAFLDTRFIVQILSVVVVTTFIWFAYNIAKMVGSVASFA